MTRVLWLLLLVLCGIGSLGGCRGRASLPPGMARTWGSYPAPGGALTLTITRRDTMLFRMLLGRTAMKGRIIVNPGRSFLTGKQFQHTYQNVSN